MTLLSMTLLGVVPVEVLGYCLSFLVEEEYAVLRQVNGQMQVVLSHCGYKAPRYLHPWVFNNSIPRIQWSLDSGRAWLHRSAEDLVKRGSLDTLQWAVMYAGCPLSRSSITEAVVVGNLDILKFLSLHCDDASKTFDTIACLMAAGRGHLHVLKWLRANGYKWNSATTSSAVSGGHLEVLKWAIENGCSWERDGMMDLIAGGRGDLEMMKWARSMGCRWSMNTFAMAANAGKLEMLKWISANRCPWSRDTLIYVGCGRYQNVVDWLFENGCPPEW